MKQAGKALSLLLLASLLLPLFSGCSDAGDNSTSSPVSDGSSSAVLSQEPVPAETEEPPFASLPEVSLGGLTVNTLIREEQKREFDAELDGDVVDDEVYARNRAIEERFDCAMTFTVEPGSWSFKDGYQNIIRGTVLGGDSTYDIVTGQSNIVQPLNVEGMFANLLDAQYIDLTKPWWVEAYTEGVNLNGSVMTVCGDCALSSFSNANVIFFNKAIMDERSIPYPYEDALEGTWTLDKLISMAESVTTDLDGDGKITPDDLHGFCAYNNSIQPFFSSCENEYTEVDADGRRVLLSPSERLIDSADRLNLFCHTDSFLDSNATYQATGVNTEPAMHEHFKEGKYLFMGLVLEGIEALRDMEVDFGILPYPKYDEDQSRYYTTILRRYTVSAVPVTASSADNSALILEALSSEGSRTIIPKYYEIALKGKYVRDESSTQVLDLVKDSLYLEFVDMYYADLGWSDFFASYVMGGTAGTYMSQYKSQEKVWSKKLDKLYEAYEG